MATATAEASTGSLALRPSSFHTADLRGLPDSLRDCVPSNTAAAATLAAALASLQGLEMTGGPEIRALGATQAVQEATVALPVKAVPLEVSLSAACLVLSCRTSPALTVASGEGEMVSVVPLAVQEEKLPRSLRLEGCSRAAQPADSSRYAAALSLTEIESPELENVAETSAGAAERHWALQGVVVMALVAAEHVAVVHLLLAWQVAPAGHWLAGPPTVQVVTWAEGRARRWGQQS